MTQELKQVDDILVKKFSNLPNDFWDFKNEDTKELTHSIHTYPAIMVYPISRNILKIVKSCQNINSLLDPFMGSGTVLLEALLAGCKEIYGNDLNPLAHRISSAKTRVITEDLDEAYRHLCKSIDDAYKKYEKILNEVGEYVTAKGYDITAKITDKENWGANAQNILNRFLTESNSDLVINDIQGLGFWFVPKCILELQIIKNVICTEFSSMVTDYFMVAFSEVTRMVSNRRNGEFKMYRMKPEKVLLYNPDVKKTFLETVRDNVAKMDSLKKRVAGMKLGNVHLSFDDSKILKEVPNDSIDLVITSPPYGDSRTTVAYGQFSRVSLQWCDYEKLSYKQIADIDKNLMGGVQYKKGVEFDLCSKVLNDALKQICNKKESLERAGDVYSFYKDLQDILRTVTQKCRKNSYQFWVVGNRTVKEVYLRTDEILVELGNNLGLKHVITMGRTISNKVMPSLNSPTNKAGKKVKTMCEELIVVLRKD